MIEPETIVIGGLTVTVIRSRRRTLSLEVDCDGVKARAPRRMSRCSISEFVRAKQKWIERHLDSLPAALPEFHFASGASVPFQGHDLQLRITTHSRRAVYVDGDHLVVPIIPSRLPPTETARRKLIRWYKQQALKQLTRQAAFFAPLIGVQPPTKIRAREYRRRWGSCDHLGTLSFNWRIILAPPEVLNYVVIHELAHCLEFNHSKRFWRLVAQQMPDWKVQQDWLYQHGARLYQL